MSKPHLDYEYTQLPDEDILRLEEEFTANDNQEAVKDRLRKKQMYSFRFKGGMI